MDKHFSDTEPLICGRLIVFVFKRLSSLFFPVDCDILIITLKLKPSLKPPSI